MRPSPLRPDIPRLAARLGTTPSAPRAIVCALALIALPATLADGGDRPYPHGEFVEDCATCHGDSEPGAAPVEGGFDHGAVAGLSLRGAHAAVSCRACHPSLEFATATNSCVGCHQDVHVGELGTDCGACHSTRNFIDRASGVRSHRLSRFPLSGAHVTLDCDACHRPVGGGARRWVGLPSECEACHAGDWQRAVNPIHEGYGIPADCETCHSPRGWSQARIDHTLSFPIFSGVHAGEWDSCRTCHTTPGTFATFSCFGCHPHSDQDLMILYHEGISGFAYDSMACLSCHPRGSS